MRRLSALLLVGLALSGCVRQAEPESPVEAATALRAQGVPYAELHAVADAAAHPLVVRETGLAELQLGASQAQTKARYGEPTRIKESPDGIWWEYEEADPQSNLKLLFTGAQNTLAQVQAWPPSAHETRTLVRVLDPVTRVTRKYGQPAKTLKLDATGAEVWVYPAANAAFVVMAPDEKARRSVGAVIVGL
jgi:hypothetical protein